MADPFQTVFLLIVALGVAYVSAITSFRTSITRRARRLLDARVGEDDRRFWIVVFGPPVAALWILLFLHVTATTFALWWSPPDIAAEGGPLAYRVHFLAIVGMLTALAGLVGFPLALIRLRATERQTVTAEQGHITDRINKAVENLGADKNVNRLGRTVRYTHEGRDLSHFEWQDEERPAPDHDSVDGKRKLVNDPWQMHPQTVPNLEVRLGALYALERIAKDSEDDHVQIMELICAYIRQNAPAPKVEILSYEPDAEKRPRIDVQTALMIIGRRCDRQKHIETLLKPKAYQLDLTESDLDGANLSEYDLVRANFARSHLHWTKLVGARLSETSFESSRMDYANFDGANLDRAEFRRTSLRRCRFEMTSMRQTEFFGGLIEGARFGEARLEGASLINLRMDADTRPYPNSLRGSALKQLTFEDRPHRPFVEAFGDGSVSLPDGFQAGDPPLEHWFPETLDFRDFHTAWRKWQAEHHPDLLPDGYDSKAEPGP